MALFKQITNKLFKTEDEKQGLYVTIDELVNTRSLIHGIRNAKTKKSSSLYAGDIKSVFKGRGLEFEEIRSYAFGDDVRDMDWRVTARRDEPYVKVFQEERDREIYVFLDLSASMIFGTQKELKSVFAAKIAALIGWKALENKDRFGCIIYDGDNTYVFKAKSGIKSLLAILKKIAEASKKVLSEPKNKNFVKALKLTEKSIKSQNNLFILSDFYSFDESVKNALSALARKGELFLMDIADKIEINPPKKGEYMVEYQGKTFVFDTYSQVYNDEYRDYFFHKKKRLKDFSNKTKAYYIELQSGEEILPQIKFV